MEIQIEQGILADAVAWAARSLPNRPSAPILSGVRISAADGQVVMSSFDYETSARITIPAQVATPGEVLVSGKLLADISRSLPSQPVLLEADEGTMNLRCGHVKFTLQTLPIADYPEVPQMPPVVGEVDSQVFAAAVAQVAVAAGRDELLPVFTGVRIEIEDEQLTFLATDRYRMALKELSWRPLGKTQTAALIPAKILDTTAKSFINSEKVTIGLAQAGTAGEGLIGFEGVSASGVRQITTRMLDGEFPKLRHIMDIQPSATVRVKTSELVSAVKRVGLVAERNTPLRMLVGMGEITLDAATGEQATAVESLEAVVEDITGTGLTIEAAGFNTNYLSDALSVIETEYVHFSFTLPGKPCLLVGLDDIAADPQLDYRHVIMLMRLPT
ncbi:MAG: DNA polymerase III subunit beta [Propionibacteriaceae bacterium]|nr:DNA polymerase III subunit beta [Propionibacteriaceae bacterium]